MEKIDIAGMRRNYLLNALKRADLAEEPLLQFHRWLEEAVAADLVEPNAMTLATADAEGRPSSRTVLLKGIEEGGFLFFTNYESRKGTEIEENPHVALTFHWPTFERQINILGRAHKLSMQKSEAYYQSRPRLSRLGAWASPQQSGEIPDEKDFAAELDALEKLHPADEIPMPHFWGGYVVIPRRVEFWQGRPNRLHDRYVYTRLADNTWEIARLSP